MLFPLLFEKGIVAFSDNEGCAFDFTLVHRLPKRPRFAGECSGVVDASCNLVQFAGFVEKRISRNEINVSRIIVFIIL